VAKRGHRPSPCKAQGERPVDEQGIDGRGASSTPGRPAKVISGSALMRRLKRSIKGSN
jgi:hypothetical protein